MEENNNSAWNWNTTKSERTMASHFKSLGKGAAAILFFKIAEVTNLGNEVL